MLAFYSAYKGNDCLNAVLKNNFHSYYIFELFAIIFNINERKESLQESDEFV